MLRVATKFNAGGVWRKLCIEWQREEISSILGCSDGHGILVGEGAGSQQGDGLTWDPGEGRVNLVCSCDVRNLEGTMQLDRLLETYHDQLRLENASKLDIMIINCLKARDQIILTVFISEHFY